MDGESEDEIMSMYLYKCNKCGTGGFIYVEERPRPPCIGKCGMPGCDGEYTDASKPKERKFGVITTMDGHVPTIGEAIAADLETGSHHRNNAAAKEFAANYPTILAVANAIDEANQQKEKHEGQTKDQRNTQ